MLRACGQERSPRTFYNGGQVEAPGKGPDQMETPVEESGEFVVIAGIALAEEAQEMFVDEIKPQEAVMIGSAGIAQARENVPGRGDGEK